MAEKIDEELKEFQLRLEGLFKELMEQNGIEVYGNLKIVVANIDKVAFLKGNTIYVNIKARGYPDFVLKYIIAHELAHIAVKRHTWRFWKVVRMVYPEYEKGKEELLKIAKGRADEETNALY
jgi:predicted metal-dependent hydrolase